MSFQRVEVSMAIEALFSEEALISDTALVAFISDFIQV
jgi:hypothetical protein